MSWTTAALTLVWTEQLPVELRVGKVLSAFKFRGHFQTCIASVRLSAECVFVQNTLKLRDESVPSQRSLGGRRFDVSVLVLSRLSLRQSSPQCIYEAEQQELDRYCFRWA